MLTGTSVTLGPILPADFLPLFRWSDDLDAARLNETYRPAVWKNQEAFWFSAGNDPSQVFFAIRKLDATPIIGYVQIRMIEPVHRSAQLGLRIGEAADRGQGYGGDALRLAVDYCWRHLGLTRIGLNVFGNNARAQRFYAAHGFATEGTLRQALFIDGQWLDLVLMGLLHPSRASGAPAS